MTSADAVGPDAVHRAVAARLPIGLVAADDVAANLTRLDRKYLVDESTAIAFVESLGPSVLALTIGEETTFAYESVYFDTEDLASFRATAHRRRHRWKLRIRRYPDGSVWLEIKRRGPRTVAEKTRIELPRHTSTDIVPAIVDDLLGDADATADDLHPALTTRYRRSTLVDPETGVRVTLDRDVQGIDPDGNTARLDGVVVEVKTSRPRTDADRLLRSLGKRPVRLSKYATLLAALDPSLARNKWHRTLRRVHTEPLAG